jgi:membrane-associated protease RseP (regulator of RpoE activity)
MSASAFARSWIWPRLWWANLSLFILTLITTTIFGFVLFESFTAGKPFDVDVLMDAYARFARRDPAIWSGLSFSGPLLLILLAHEFGHYFTCVRRNVDASLPYFLPSPLFFGTFGAFIRIRSPIYTRKSLFDIGFAGPLAGFIVLVPFLIAGVSMSRVVHGAAAQASFVSSPPLALRFAEWLKFPHAASGDILLHPVAVAAWAGLLATAFNLLPMGQLDGGHILYAVFGQRGHRWVSFVVIGLLALLGRIWPGWWLWAAVMFFLGRRHPLVYDSTPLFARRLLLGSVALALLAICFSIEPIRY